MAMAVLAAVLLCAPPTFANDDTEPSREGLSRLDAVILMGQWTTNYNHATPSQAKNIELIAKRANGMVVNAGEMFSYNARFGPYDEAHGFGWGRMFVGTRIVPSIGGGVCQGASTLYNVVVQAGLPVLERHKHGLTVPYLPAGQDATVAYGVVDFKFRNNTGGPLVLIARGGHRHLTMALYGSKEPPDVVWEHHVLAREKMPTIRKVSPKLPPGQKRVLAPGQPGITVRSALIITRNGKKTRRELDVDAYRASPRVVEVGPAGPVEKGVS